MEAALLANLQRLFLEHLDPENPNLQMPSDDPDLREDIMRFESTTSPHLASPSAPRFMDEAVFVRLREEMEKREKSSENTSFSSNIGMRIDFSTVPFSSLTRTPIRNMTLPKRHVGQYLLGRVWTPANRMVGIHFAVEDPEGSTVDISIYHFPTAFEVKAKFLDAIFPIGTIIIIREPTLKMPSQGNRPTIRVDSPSDLIFINKNDPILKDVRWRNGVSLPGSLPTPTTFKTWKAQGDAHFRNKHFLAAAMSYTDGHKAYPSEHVLLLNRSMAYLRLEFYSRAWDDCNFILQIDDLPKADRTKALYRAGTAKYGLGNYLIAKTYFEEALSVDAGQEECRVWVHKCMKRIEEQRTGDYDFVGMYKLSQNPGVRMDVADFVGNVRVTTMDSKGGGRGVVAMKDIHAGELLVVAKPFASVFHEDFPGSKERLAVSNLITKANDTKCDAYLVNKVATMILGDPDRANLIYDLYAGPELSQPPSSYPPAPVERDPQPFSPLFNDQISIDMPRIEAATAYNAFMPVSLPPAGFLSTSPDYIGSLGGPPAAIYTLPSLFNHSCVPNCTNYHFGDTMIIRALQDLKAGTELTLSYGNIGCTYRQRSNHLKRWINKCDCELCEADRSDGVRACIAREQVMDQISKLKSAARDTTSSRSSVPDARRMLSEAQATYMNPNMSHLPRIALYAGHMRVGYELQFRGQILELVAEQMKTLESLGIKVINDSIFGPLSGKKAKRLPIRTDHAPLMPTDDGPVMVCIGLATGFKRAFEDEARAERWLKAARWLENVCHGGGVQLFNLRFEEVLRGWEILDFNNRIKA